MKPRKTAFVRRALIEAIRAGEYRDRPFPSSRELAERFKVSATTADTAMRELDALGVVRRYPGNGTWLRARKSYWSKEDIRELDAKLPQGTFRTCPERFHVAFRRGADRLMIAPPSVADLPPEVWPFQVSYVWADNPNRISAAGKSMPLAVFREVLDAIEYVKERLDWEELIPPGEYLKYATALDEIMDF